MKGERKREYSTEDLLGPSENGHISVDILNGVYSLLLYYECGGLDEVKEYLKENPLKTVDEKYGSLVAHISQNSKATYDECVTELNGNIERLDEAGLARLMRGCVEAVQREVDEKDSLFRGYYKSSLFRKFYST